MHVDKVKCCIVARQIIRRAVRHGCHIVLTLTFASTWSLPTKLVGREVQCSQTKWSVRAEQGLQLRIVAELLWSLGCCVQEQRSIRAHVRS